MSFPSKPPAARLRRGSPAIHPAALSAGAPTLALLALLAACGSAPPAPPPAPVPPPDPVTQPGRQPPATGFLCCNLRSDGAWISDSNYQESGKHVLPLGTPVRFDGYGRYRVHVVIDGKRQAIGNDYSRDLAMPVFAARYIVPDDPRKLLLGATPRVRRAIETARVTAGMTRPQVLMALGYPIGNENPHLDAAEWRYWLWTTQPFTVRFDREGLVEAVSGDAETMRHVLLP